MTALILARLQFAFTIAFHYIYPPLSIGLGLILVIMEGLYLRTRNPLYHQMTRFWVRIFGLIFAIGVATGVVMEFEFGTNWATYSRYVGDVFGSALASEGIFAFFLESGFLAILLFGWDKVPRGAAFFLHRPGGFRRPFQRGLDHRGQLLDADPVRLPHRRRRPQSPRRDHQFPGDGLQPFKPRSAAARLCRRLGDGGVAGHQRRLPITS